jgi:hypothetical protein
MKALTLTQPWASLMATMAPDGKPWKTIETRSWSTNYRGEMVIHASRTCLSDDQWTELMRGSLKWDPSLRLPAGEGLCVVRLVGVVKTTEMHKAEFILGHKPNAREIPFGNYQPNRFAWLTEYVRPILEPQLISGRLGLWDWEKHGGLSA